MLPDPSSTCRLSDEIGWLRSGYDAGAVTPAVYTTIKKLEEELAWRPHAKRTDLRRSADHPTA